MPHNSTRHGRHGLRRGLVAAMAGVMLVALLAADAGAAIRARRVVGGLAFPAAFTFAPSGRIFIGEKNTGRVKIHNRKTGRTRIFFRFGNVNAQGERGVLGVAIDPDYRSNRFVYVYVTRNTAAGVRNQIVRLTNVGGRGRNPLVIYRAPSGATNHQGGRILFGPDGLLYAVVGDGGDPANSQNTANPLGSVLRMTRSGAGVAGNLRGRVWAFGIRNSFGFAFDPRTGRMWETENGPTCNDELNRIVPGGNHAWGPSQDCSTGTAPHNTNRDGPEPRILPRHVYNPVIAPTGAAFCVRCGLGSGSGGRLFFGAVNDRALRRVTLTANRLGVRSQRIVFRHSAPIFSVEVDPNRRLFFSDGTSIYRLVAR